MEEKHSWNKFCRYARTAEKQYSALTKKAQIVISFCLDYLALTCISKVFTQGKWKAVLNCGKFVSLQTPSLFVWIHGESPGIGTPLFLCGKVHTKLKPETKGAGFAWIFLPIRCTNVFGTIIASVPSFSTWSKEKGEAWHGTALWWLTVFQHVFYWGF